MLSVHKPINQIITQTGSRMNIIKTAFAIGLMLVASTALAERKEKDLNGAEKSGSEVSAITEFDLVILNGRVIDPETKLNAVRNIGIINGTML